MYFRENLTGNPKNPVRNFRCISVPDSGTGTRCFSDITESTESSETQKVVKNDSKVVKNDSKVVKNDSKVVKNDSKVVKNDSEVVKMVQF